MTPQEKANELVQQYLISTPIPFHIEDAKICSLIAVENIIKTNPTIEIRIYKNNCSWIERKSNIYYWEQVKTEIEKL